jgi:cytoskeletal protein CcmA (bactofilin family)
VPNVVLKGTVRGDLTASERVELGPTARVIGNVYYNLIEMAIGAEINGKLVHGTDARAGQAAEESGKTGDTAKMPAPKIATGAK